MFTLIKPTKEKNLSLRGLSVKRQEFTAIGIKFHFGVCTLAYKKTNQVGISANYCFTKHN